MTEFAKYVGHSLQLVLGMVFLVAAVAKLRSPSLFVAVLSKYELFPAALSGVVARGLILVELLIAASLLSGIATAVAVPASGLLLLGFTIVVGSNVRRGRVIPCGCFGSASELVSPRTLARLVMLMGATAVIAVEQASPTWTPMKVGASLERVLLTVVLAAFIVITATWLLHVHEVRALLQRRSKRIVTEG